jgi:hypothetical protein
MELVPPLPLPLPNCASATSLAEPSERSDPMAAQNVPISLEADTGCVERYIITGSRAADWTAPVRFPGLLSVKTDSGGAHTTSYPKGTGDWKGVKLTTHGHLVPRSRKVELMRLHDVVLGR